MVPGAAAPHGQVFWGLTSADHPARLFFQTIIFRIHFELGRNPASLLGKSRVYPKIQEGADIRRQSAAWSCSDVARPQVRWQPQRAAAPFTAVLRVQ